MSYLFLDTTDHLVLGLLNDKFEWIEFYESEERKSSSKIHGIIHELTERHNIELSKLNGVIQVAGPGSYTGMRVSDGIVQVLEWNKIKSYGLYHFEIPDLLGESPYCWYANAFKGEVFVYEKSEAGESKRLFNEGQAKSLIKDKIESGEKAYTHYGSESVFPDTHFSSEILKNCPEKIFPKVISRDLVTEIYYYRSLEEEFKPSSK